MTPHDGLLNAHCHLELSWLRGAIPPGLPFTEWLVHVVEAKRSCDTGLARAAARRALAGMQETGTEYLLDIDAMGWTGALLADESPFPALSFRELICFRTEETGAVMALVEDDPLQGRTARGISPHAPYSTQPLLLRGAAELARRRGQWLCIHAAETAEEVAMMRDGRGDLVDLFRSRGVLPPQWRHPGRRPVEWLAELGVLGPRTLLVHCNHLSGNEVDAIVRTGASVVVCPGTHVYFGRGEFPLARLLAAGVPVYLGTDSLASNEALDMHREIRLAAELSPGVPRATIEALARGHRAVAFGLT